MTKEQIKKVNLEAPNNWGENEQGVFVEPNYIPVHIKEPVIYMRWLSGGWSGGSCWDDSNPQPFERNKPNFEVLDLVLKEIAPNVTYLQYKDIEKLIHTNSETEYEYYGNSSDFSVEYIILSELENYLTITQPLIAV